MKITKKALKQIIKEETQTILEEGTFEALIDKAIEQAIKDKIIDDGSPKCAEDRDKGLPGQCQAALKNLASNYGGSSGFGKFMKKAGGKFGKWAREKLGEEVFAQIIQEEIKQLVKEASMKPDA